MKNRFDVIVAGGGLSGVAAAIASAREGNEVLLIERYGFLGGMATAGMVNPFMPYWIRTGEADDYKHSENRLNCGIFTHILEELDKLEGLGDRRVTFDEEIMKLILNRMVLKFGIKVLFHSFVSGADRVENRLESITVVNKSGTEKYYGKYFIDATGDADVAALSGCEYKLGRDEDGYCQPMTMSFRITHVDTAKFNEHKRETIEKYKEMQLKGEIKNPREDILAFAHILKDTIHFNSTRIIKKSAVNAEELTQAEFEVREQVYELYQFVKKYAPGFENSRIIMTAPQIGIRESRRIIGEYMITEEDLMNTVKFEDSIARGNYPIDIHNPSGTGTVIKRIPYGTYYTIPYRALIPKYIENLIVAGRPISSTHGAHSAYRVMPICTCIGEAAGIASAIALKDNLKFNEIDATEVQKIITKYGGKY